MPDETIVQVHAVPATLVEVGATSADRDPVAVYLASLGSESSRRTMRKALVTIVAELGAPADDVIPWAALRYPHVAALRGRLADRLAPATVNKLLCAVRGVAREAMRLGILAPGEYTRIADVEGLRGARLPAGRHLEPPELISLFAACTSGPGADRDRALLAVLRVAGLRRSELAALDLLDLDRDGWTLRVQGKGRKERRAYVLQARPELEVWLALRAAQPGPLFCAVLKSGRLTQRRLGESSVAFIVGRAATRAGLKHTTPHDMRRTYVGDLLDLGADISTVQRLAGHANVATTVRYDRRPERAASKAAALLSVPRPDPLPAP